MRGWSPRRFESHAVQSRRSRSGTIQNRSRDPARRGARDPAQVAASTFASGLTVTVTAGVSRGSRSRLAEVPRGFGRSAPDEQGHNRSGDGGGSAWHRGLCHERSSGRQECIERASGVDEASRQKVRWRRWRPEYHRSDQRRARGDGLRRARAWRRRRRSDLRRCAVARALRAIGMGARGARGRRLAV